VSEAVLDASAILALLNDEPGSEKVSKVLPGAAVSAVNLSEVVAKLSELGMPEAEIREALVGLALTIHPFNETMACTAGRLRPATKKLGLSLGDRACLALGIHVSLPVLTTDHGWKELELPTRVVLIR
jgi:PIN domain nuclease of toxin-antitoxin system